MRTNIFVRIAVITMAVLGLSSCSSKLRPYSSDMVKVAPQPMELKGGRIPVSATATFAPKWFKKKAQLIITPVLRYANGETWGPSFVYQGEKVRGNERSISFAQGDAVKMDFSFHYKPDMQRSELYLHLKGKKGNKEYTLPEVKIADGVIATEALASAANSSAAIAPDAFQRIIKEAYNANIHFLIQQAEVRSKELGKKEIADWRNTVKEANEAQNKRVSVEVQAYASPDGGIELNERLSGKRESNTTASLKREFSRNRIKNVDIAAHYTAQDWEGFKELVEKSNIQDKELVLRVLQMYPDPETREREIKNISVVFKQLADDILPQLRRSRLTANVEIIGKSDDEIRSLAASKPEQLNIEELLYAATLVSNPDEQEAIYRKAIKIYPADYRAYNNIGMLYYRDGKMADAAEWFASANAKKPGNPETSMNMGLLALMNGERDKAMQLFGGAGNVPELQEARALLALSHGDYAEAVSIYGEAKTNNAAVAQILNHEYNKASQTLEQIGRPDATTAYLKAVIAARTNDMNGVINNLRSAIEQDRHMAQHAANDMEFAKYIQNAAIKELLR